MPISSARVRWSRWSFFIARTRRHSTIWVISPETTPAGTWPGQRTTLARWGYDPIAVLNAADEPSRRALGKLTMVRQIRNPTNLGLARALNQGIAGALEGGAGYVMLLDQDSRTTPELGKTLLQAATAFQAVGGALGCIGPVPVDRKRPAAATTRRDRAAPGATTLAVPTVITSGMVIPRSAIERIGGMWNELFIDHVDHEWCFRAQAAGLAVLLALDVVLEHNIGEAGFSLFGAYKPIHRSSVRHYHIVRNTLWLSRRSFIPRGWRVREIVKLLVRIPAYVAFSADRTATARAVIRASLAGLRSPKSTYQS